MQGGERFIFCTCLPLRQQNCNYSHGGLVNRTRSISTSIRTSLTLSGSKRIKPFAKRGFMRTKFMVTPQQAQRNAIHRLHDRYKQERWNDKLEGERFLKSLMEIY